MRFEENFTIKEAAKILKRNPKTLYQWIREGIYFEKVIQVGDGYLIPASELKRLLKENSFNPKFEEPPATKPEKSTLINKPYRRIISDGIH